MQTRLVVHENLRAGSDEHTTPNLRAAGNVRPRIDNAAFADPHFVTQRATEVAQRESIENNVHSANHPEQTSAPFPIRAVSKPMCGTRIGSLLFSRVGRIREPIHRALRGAPTLRTSIISR